MVAIEKVQAQIIAEVDDQSFKKAWEETKLFARDTKKELDKSFLFKLQLDKAQTKIQLEQARWLLRQAKKDWDKELILKYTLKTDELQSKLTEAWRRLNNFKNTWEASVSRLARLFWWLWNVVWWLITKLWWLAAWAWLLTLWSRAVFLWDKLEQANISFETMLGSAEKAKTLLDDLAVFASKTPFELIWLRDTAKQLLAFWIENENIIDTLKSLWDVSAWLSVPIERIALAYWQVKVAWRLMWQDLLQLTSAWVPLIAELAKNMWIAQSEVKDLVSAWKVWFSDVELAFKTMTWEWWKFFNLMEKQSDTLSWQWSNLKDQADLLAEKLWTKLIPFLKKWIELINKIIDVTTKYSKQIWFLILALWTLVWARWLLWLFTIITKLIPAIKWMTLVQWLLTWSINLSTISMRAFVVAAWPLLWTLALITTALWWAKAAYDAYANALNLIDATNTMQKSQDAMFKVMDKWVQNRKDNIAELKKQNEELSKSDEKNAKKQIEINNKKIEANKKFLKANLALMTWEQSTISDEERNKINKEWIELMKEAQKEQDKLWWIVQVNWEKNIQTLNSLNWELKDMKTKLWWVWIGTDEFKKLQEEIDKTEDLISSLTSTTTWWSKKIQSEIKKEEEERTKARIKQQEQDLKFFKFQKEKEEKRLERMQERDEKLEKWKDIVKDYYENVRDELDDSQDRIDEFDKKIEDSTQKIKDLNKELEWERWELWVDLAERRLEVEERIKELESKHWWIRNLSRISEEALKNLWVWELSWDVTWKTALEFKNLLKELEDLQKNANLVTEEDQQIAEENETERLIRLSNEKQLQIQNDIDEEEKKLEKFKTFKDQEKEIYKWIDDYRTTLEQNFTSILQLEVAKRISALERLKAQAIETANALASAWITTNNNTNNTNNNVQVNLEWTWFTSIDAQNIWNALTNTIDLAEKWINQ